MKQTTVLDLIQTGILALALVLAVAMIGLCWIFVALAQNPVKFSVDGGVDCGTAIDGNVQFDSREVNLTERFNESGRAYYPLTDGVPAELIRVPDFKQFKLTHGQLNCKANGAVSGTVPSFLFVTMVKLSPTTISNVLSSALSDNLGR